MKLWKKDSTNTSAIIEEFTVGRDKEFDIVLAKYDVLGSIAHVKMLGAKTLMTSAETEAAVRGLEEILRSAGMAFLIFSITLCLTGYTGPRMAVIIQRCIISSTTITNPGR